MFLQEGIKQAQKSAGAASLQLKLNEAVTSADVAVALCQEYCVLRIDDGLDANAVREAASLVIEKHKVCSARHHAYFTFLCTTGVSLSLMSSLVPVRIVIFTFKCISCIYQRVLSVFFCFFVFFASGTALKLWI